MYCCAKCFKNKSIQKFISNNTGEKKADCVYCGSKNTEVVSLIDLRHFLVGCIDKAYEYNDDFVDDVQRYSVAEIMTEIEDVFSDDTDSELLMSDIFSKSFIDIKDAINDYYADINNEAFYIKYDSLGVENLDAYHAWESFKYEVMHYNRFFDVTDKQSRESYLWQLLKYLKEIKVTSGTCFYRVRGFDPLPDNINDLDLYMEMGPPPPGKSINNRMNPAGIPYLYLSDTKETALLEKGDNLRFKLIAEFTAKKNLRVVDLSDSWMVDIFSIFDSEYNHDDYWIKDFIIKFTTEISKPVDKEGEEHPYEYVLTQIVAEYLRMQNYDGICYSSSKCDGKNFVFFYGSKPDESLTDKRDFLGVRMLPYFADYFDITKIEKDNYVNNASK